jgi:hypothetical protein
MPTKPFRVAVTGDTGFDIYTEYVKGDVSDDARLIKPEAAYDLEVPSGASLTTRAFELLFKQANDPQISVCQLLPAIGRGNPSYTTLVKSLVELDRFGDAQGNTPRKLRMRRARPIHDKDTPANEEHFHELVTNSGAKPVPEDVDLLVVNDRGGSWRKYPTNKKAADSATSEDAMRLVESILDRQASFWPSVIVILNYNLPAVVYDDSSRRLSFSRKLSFWQSLSRHSDKVCVICSAGILRQEGAAISRRLSWEQTIEDLAADLFLFDQLAILSQFKHLIIRFGVTAALHLMNEADGRKGGFVFAPLAKSGIYRDPVEDGDINDKNVLLSAALVRMIASQPNAASTKECFTAALKSGLLAGMRAFDKGYTVWWDEPERKPDNAADAFLEALYSGDVRNAIQQGYPTGVLSGDQRTLGDVGVPSELLNHHPTASGERRSHWEILRSAVNPQPDADSNLDAISEKPSDISRINIAAAIVTFGPHAVLNRNWQVNDEADRDVIAMLLRPAYFASREEIRDYRTLPRGKRPNLPAAHLRCDGRARVPSPIYVPLLTFGKLTLIERQEIEGLRSIRNLFKDYLEDSGRAGPAFPPISIAVFGSPGSGKSFAVKQIAFEINRNLNEPRRGLEAIEYNVAQFRSVDELGDAITRASVINNEGKTPLVFFDEFDCGCEGTPLGWLKYFLSAMQDGIFYGARQTIKMARAIFVFAGGVYQSFESFDPSSALAATGRERRDSDEIGNRLRHFRDQKGPDFISRLRGHINILPINVGEGEVKPIIRRAFILRGLLEKKSLIVKARGQHVAYIDPDIVYALLTVDLYRHGARSMEAILQMCSLIQGKIEKASLPSRAQLNMHVDADEFYLRMYRGRFRPTSPRFPDNTAEPEVETPGLPIPENTGAAAELDELAKRMGRVSPQVGDAAPESQDDGSEDPNFPLS